MGFIEEIGQLIEDNVALTQGTDLFLGQTPSNAQDEVTTVIATSGSVPLFAHDISGVNVDQPSFQVYNRAPAYTDAQAKANEIYKLLNQQVNFTILGVFYPRIMAQQSPFSLGRDDNDRSEIVCNYSVRKSVSP